VIFIILGQGPLFPIWGLVAFGEPEPFKLGELYRQRAEWTCQTFLAAGLLAGWFTNGAACTASGLGSDR
jgi:hypothetical protein